MAERIDMSLDEIIKRDKISVGRGGRRGGGGKFGTRAGAGARGGRRNIVKKISATSRNMRTGAPRAPAKFTARTTRRISDKWQHDKFTGEVKSSILMISNLDFGVSDQDIRELFSEFGPVKKASVHYDSSGRSLGKAEVVFLKTADAIRAMNKYNGVQLDGRPMNIQPVANPAKASLASRIGNGEGFKMFGTRASPRGRPTRQAINPRARRGRGGGPTRGAARRNTGPKRNLTAEELDADLDAYTNKV